MKQGLSGSAVNEMQVNDIENEAKEQARLNLDRVKALERNNPKRYIRNGIGYHTEGFKDLAKQIMNDRFKERYKRSE